MPARIQPCLALLKAKPPAGPEWIHEVKWDGYRIALHVDHGKVTILTRGRQDWTDRFPAIEEAARPLPVASAILDGEAVVVDEIGRTDFNLLQKSLDGRGAKRTSDQSLLYAFDLLYFDSHDISQVDLSAGEGDIRSMRLTGWDAAG
jgi:bifunctional non-homologous end joining protein LigD